MQKKDKLLVGYLVGRKKVLQTETFIVIKYIAYAMQYTLNQFKNVL